MKRSILALLFIVLIVTAVLWPRGGPSWVQIDVRPGTSAKTVAGKLMDQGLVMTVYPMLFWMKVLGAEHRIKVGRYRFPKGRSAFWIVNDLVNGKTEKVPFVIPEGWASWQIAERLELKMVCSADKFKEVVAARGLEGYLFPATYDLDVGLEAKEVADIFLSRFNRAWTAEMAERAQYYKWGKKETLTLASIIEREAMVRDEQAMISAVYHNRLKMGKRLEADPTVQYALGYWKKRLLFSDIKSAKSPYNTYLYAGLPPGPICNPGEDAIRAALWPADSKALYFVAREDGRHHFSATYAEHAQRVRDRRQSMKKRK